MYGILRKFTGFISLVLQSGKFKFCRFCNGFCNYHIDFYIQEINISFEVHSYKRISKMELRDYCWRRALYLIFILNFTIEMTLSASSCEGYISTILFLRLCIHIFSLTCICIFQLNMILFLQWTRWVLSRIYV